MNNFKKTLKYLIALGAAFLLLWLVFRQIDLAALFSRLTEVKYRYVVISVGLMLIAHLVRAYRWSLMLTPIGYRVGLGRMLLAVMVGYLANLFVPRMGEITRCAVLKRTDNVPMAVSIGSVVAERIIDLLTLISIIFLALLLEYDLLSGYLKEVFTSKALSVSQNLVAIYIPPL